MGGSGALNLLFSVLARQRHITCLVVLRVLQGVCQGGLNAPQKSLWGRWAPTNERTTMVALFRVGTNFGTLLTNVIARKFCFKAVRNKLDYFQLLSVQNMVGLGYTTHMVLSLLSGPLYGLLMHAIHRLKWLRSTS